MAFEKRNWILDPPQRDAALQGWGDTAGVGRPATSREAEGLGGGFRAPAGVRLTRDSVRMVLARMSSRTHPLVGKQGKQHRPEFASAAITTISQ